MKIYSAYVRHKLIIVSIIHLVHLMLELVVRFDTHTKLVSLMHSVIDLFALQRTQFIHFSKLHIHQTGQITRRYITIQSVHIILVYNRPYNCSCRIHAILTGFYLWINSNWLKAGVSQFLGSISENKMKMFHSIAQKIIDVHTPKNQFNEFNWRFR